MLQYAAQDVLYLPLVYEKMRKNFLLPYNDKVINSETGECHIQTVTIQAKIMSDSAKFAKYPQINAKIKGQLQVGLSVTAFIKHCRQDLVYCSLNLGCNVTGVISDKKSRYMVQKFHQFGDIINTVVCHKEQHGPHKQVVHLEYHR